MTADGYVFRVDMRLRPYGDGGPLVSSFEMLENYFITQGREWERYAWIKGRALTGERGAELDDLVRPFVYRRHLDYSAFASMRDLHRQIRLEVERRDISDNIKLGAGRHPRDRVHRPGVSADPRRARAGPARQPTLAVLPPSRQARSLLPRPCGAGARRRPTFSCATSSTGCSTSTTSRRTCCPRGEGDRERVARMHGLAELPTRSQTALAAHRERVSRHFEDIFAAAPDAVHPHARLWHSTEEDARRENRVRSRRAWLPPARGRSPSGLKAMRSGRRYRRNAGAKPGAARPAGAARDRSGGRRPGARRHARAHARTCSTREPARILSRAARGIPAGARNSSPS